MHADDMSIMARLQRPTGPVDVVLDSDTYNEIDDQYALAYLVKSPDRLRLQAIYAAPFLNNKSTSPQDGMEKSHQEIGRILSLMGREDLHGKVFKGSRHFLHSETRPAQSAAASDLVQRSLGYTAKRPLYVVAIGAITNIASAILMDPGLVDRIVLVWLGGNALDWPDSDEFNMRQDVAAARVVLGCGLPVVLLPCMGVVSAFRLSGPELEHHLRGKNPLCDYLVDVTTSQALADGGNATWSRVIWDVCAVAWLQGEAFTRDRWETAPIPQYDHHYARDNTRHPIRYVYHIERDRLVEDLFMKLGS